MGAYEHRKTYKDLSDIEKRSQGILTDEEIRQFVPKAADELEVFRSHLGQPLVSLPNGLSQIHVPVRSAAARCYLTNYFRLHEATTPPEGSVRRAIRELEDRAGAASFIRCEHRLHALAATYCGVPDDPFAFYIHFAGPSSEAIEITARGANITTPTDIAFRLAPTELALPDPKPHPTTGLLLAPLFNLLASPRCGAEPRSDLSESQPLPQRDSAKQAAIPTNPTSPCSAFSAVIHPAGPTAARIAALLLSPFQPAGPRPILLIRGPENSGKTTLARALRNLVDPTSTTFQLPTGSEKKLADLAATNSILAFDDIGRPRPAFQHGLRKLSSGLTRTFRPSPKLDPVSYEISRPIILTQNSADPYPEELGARILLIELDPIPPDQRRPAGQLLKQFDRLRSRLLHELGQALSTVLRNLKDTAYPDVPRFADLARYLFAAAADLGLSEFDIRAAFEPDVHPAIAAIRDFLASTNESTWTGTATDLLHQLPLSISLNPNHLTRLLRRHHAQLPAHALTLSRTKSTRTLTFSKTCNHRHPHPSAPPRTLPWGGSSELRRAFWPDSSAQPLPNLSLPGVLGGESHPATPVPPRIRANMSPDGETAAS